MQDDNQLVIKAQKGDNIAFEQLVMKYDRHVLNIAYGYRNNMMMRMIFIRKYL